MSSPAEKIALFRTLFRGRTEVYARRFESRKTGRAGYQPACGNEWDRALCEKARIKCSDCPNQRWLPVSDEVLRRHLEGEDGGRPFVMVVYPMLLDETCHFLAADFDGEQWRADAPRMRLCSTTDIMSCAFWPKTLVADWTTYSTQSWPHWRIGGEGRKQ